MFKKNIKKNEEISSQLSNKDKLNAAKLNNASIKEKIKRKRIKLGIILVILTVVIIAVSGFLITYLSNMKYKPYVKYEEKMKTYGFEKLYDNGSAKTTESVTKSEALKIALGTVLNTNEILSGIDTLENEYTNSLWVEFAKNSAITKEDININNCNDKVKYIDVISYFENCKLKFLTEQTVKDTEAKLKDIDKYTVEQQTAIKDMLANEIISKLSNNLKGDENIFKGQLNELVINFVEKYNTITLSGDKLNINPEKVPSNADQYPYTITTVDKSVYEIPFESEFSPRAMNAKDVYAYKKEYYPRIQKFSEEFFNTILNIDYRTISEEGLKQKIKSYFIFAPNEFAIKSYVKHVKDNEIVIEGKSKLQVPIIYYDGFSYRARLKLTFEIKQSKTKENLIYLDYLHVLKKTYTQNSYDLLVDYFLSTAIGSDNIYLKEVELYKAILDTDKCGITKEIDNETYFKQEEKQ
ncbi:MAG: hypothetical protein PHD15_01655 [Clostridia bacterium]|nr:hypothetical protein [Clostridia bacterium]MDD4386456.1 hypothetical protein [Clostridia bacterium]